MKPFSVRIPPRARLIRPPLPSRRTLAVPVNPSSSVDALLGTSIPPPPSQSDLASQPPPSRPNNPNDLSDLLNPKGKNSRDNDNNRDPWQSGTSSGFSSRYAEIQRIRGTAIGAQRRGTPIPSTDDLLDQAFRPYEEPQLVDREHPHPVDALNGRNELDESILEAARALHSVALGGGKKATNLSKLLSLYQSRAYNQLSIELPYEPNPPTSRKVPLTSAKSTEKELQQAEDDGVLLIAYVAGLDRGRGQERISVCSGFAVEGGSRLPPGEGDGNGDLVVTCAHTLRASVPTAQPQEARGAAAGTTDGTTESESSVALAITRTGVIYPIRTLLSSLPRYDLILLQLDEAPLRVSPRSEEKEFFSSSKPADQASGSANPIKPLRTLPVSPYPAVVNTELSVSSFWGWEDDSGSILPSFLYDTSNKILSTLKPRPPPKGREVEVVKAERDDAGRSRWGRVRLVEYKDATGAEAKTGTYDELAQLDYKLIATSPFNPPALKRDGLVDPNYVGNPHATSSILGQAKGDPSTAQATKGLPNFPPPGSSGGPVVDVETGSVVGIVKGHKMSVLEGRRGDAVPAEKVFEFFSLPGLGKK
ncbi:hypothetical protein IE53DRAFT_383898 [Violaceomyces palustris]|uniref:Uncharacterized protein n=1 Tax=Violaceomyces palustris TaxID=1673888 RepID=A0ACD0P6A3_9BASI|nr:hypothetical protein IE53DRAFT_383898 [Violaceomyces palustris]